MPLFSPQCSSDFLYDVRISKIYCGRRRLLDALETLPHPSTTQQLTASDTLETLAYILLLLRIVSAGIEFDDGYDSQ